MIGQHDGMRTGYRRWIFGLRGRCKLIEAAAGFAAATVFSDAITLIGNLVTARWLTPLEYGSVQTAFLLSAYVGFLHFGVLQGFTRQYPLLVGAGRLKEAENLAQRAHAFIRISALAGVVIGVAQVLLFATFGGSWMLLLASVAQVAYVGFDMSTGVRYVTILGHEQFGKISRIKMLAGVVGCVGIVAVWLFGVAGQCIRLVLPVVTNALLLRRETTEISEAPWRPHGFVWIARIGLPIMLCGSAAGVFMVADRTVIACRLGPKAVGLYAVSGCVGMLVAAVMAPISSALYNRANRIYGETGTIASLLPVLRLYLLATAGLVPLMALTYITLPPMVRWLLPGYMEGIVPARIMCLTAVFQGATACSVLFYTIRLSFVPMVAYLVGLGIVFGVGFLIPSSAVSLEIVAWLRLGAMGLVAAVTMAWFAVLVTKGDHNQRGETGQEQNRLDVLRELKQ